MKYFFPLLIIAFLTVCGLNQTAGAAHNLLPSLPSAVVEVKKISGEYYLFFMERRLLVPYQQYFPTRRHNYLKV